MIDMSAKFLNVIQDETHDLHKQFGCISGLLQVFDRQHLLARRRLSSQKGLTLGNSASESNGRSPKTVLIENPSHNENHRTSSDSSRNSCSSSSCSSSFSSLECSKPPLQESSSILDFRDIVKESIYRENSGLSVKTEAPREIRKVVVKNKDSPRPLPASHAASGKGSRSSVDLDQSMGVLAKLKGGPWKIPPRGELPRNSFESKPREPARFSCDGREVSRGSSDPRESRISVKLREKPRFSLDSRQSSLKEMERRDSDQRILRALALRQESGEIRQSPGVVARLMGLEAMPARGEDLGANETHKRNDNSLLPSPRVAEEFKKDSRVSSPRLLQNPAPCSRMPSESAQRSQPEKDPNPSKKQESVYGEIARKLNELEFQQSNKDLRALKQILDAIRAKGLLEENKAESKPSEIAVSPRTAIPRDPDSAAVDGKSERGIGHQLDSPIVIMKPARSVNRCSTSSPPSASSFDSRVGLRKVRTDGTDERKRASSNTRQIKDQSSPRNGLRDGDLQVHISAQKKPGSPRPQQLPIEFHARSSGSSSPRMQQKRFSLERRSQSEANKQQHANSQTDQSVSPRARTGGKSRAEQKLNARLPRSRTEIGRLKSQDDEISLRSYSNMSLSSHVETEEISSNQSPKLDFGFFHASQSPSRIAIAPTSSSVAKHNKEMRHYGEDHASAEREASTIEQPSPVSVLNGSFYRDESPASPVDTSSFASRDYEDRSAGGSKHLPSVPRADEVDPKKLGNIASLVKKLEFLSSKDESTELRSPDDSYISELLLASGLLVKDLSAVFLPSNVSHPINPELFLVLEQKMSSWSVPEVTKIRRKLVFDVVNELLAEKLELNGPEAQMASYHHNGKITRVDSSGKHLFSELCREIEKIESFGVQTRGSAAEEDEEDGLKSILNRDMDCQNQAWSGNGREIPGLVLDIERSIFKDLIDEVVNGEISSLTEIQACRKRQLLAK